MGAFMLSNRERKSILDPRTKILLILTITSVVIGGGNGGFMNVVKPALTAVPLILFLAERKWKASFLYTGIYIAAFLGELFLVPKAQGFFKFHSGRRLRYFLPVYARNRHGDLSCQYNDCQ